MGIVATIAVAAAMEVVVGVDEARAGRWERRAVVLLSLPLLLMPPLLPAQTAILMLHRLLYRLRLRDITTATSVPATLVKPERLDIAVKFAGAALLDLLLLLLLLPLLLLPPEGMRSAPL